jgi:tRNA uridine 5-carboxymethylaminomethyl modification enzyme
MENIAQMSCNPSVGGPAKAHLVREVDALGGQIGLAADETFIQLRMLNTSRGPAVRGLRAQVDKAEYQVAMRNVLESQDNLWVLQTTVNEILTAGGLDA